MALDDRDYMNDGARKREPEFYNPNDFRGPTRAPGEELLPGWNNGPTGYRPKKSKLDFFASMLRLFVVVAMTFLVVGTILHRNDPDPFAWTHGLINRIKLLAAGPDHQPPAVRPNEVVVQVSVPPIPEPPRFSTAPAKVFVAPRETVCVEQVPTRSGFWRVSEPAASQSAKWVRISNFISKPAFFVLTEPSDGSRIATGYVRPGESAMLKLRGSHTSLSMSIGSRWCNKDTGWLDGVRTNIIGGLRVEATSRGATLELRPGQGGDSPNLVLDQEWIVGGGPSRPAPEYQARQGSIGAVQFANGTFATLIRTQQGYSVQGSISRVPVIFVVDTGATITSVPESWARSLGVTSCTIRMFNTANGKTQGCVARVSSITFGPFEVESAEVAFMKNLSMALLGMNALQQMQVVEQGREMVLRPR
ncbi:retropepsin-like aspartic protease [Ottowia sp.]|uniref:retropepsin-like aspartic protease family protein n=1 Tax=Ottowia sp. TaxID=1898956 RepID=UPI0025F9DA45|nr:retropepsin-like aspartic protease [Ottowia sp.]MBK6616149.1 retroviral-like aspartic protease family protein [Ottowia sp.]